MINDRDLKKKMKTLEFYEVDDPDFERDEEYRFLNSKIVNEILPRKKEVLAYLRG
jgi:hypothetical protein